MIEAIKVGLECGLYSCGESLRVLQQKPDIMGKSCFRGMVWYLSTYGG